MKIIDYIIIIGIAIIYNIFVHNIASLSYRELQYEDKHQNTIIMITLFGALGIIVSKFIIDKNKKYHNDYASKGLFLGGTILLITALYANWDYMTEELKLLFIGFVFMYLIWWGYKREKDKVDGKINEKIIDDILEEKN